VARKAPPGKRLNATTARGWRTWLRKHYRSENEIWLVFHKKHTGRPRISYNDAVEEALCFGWIDSTVRSLDADRFAQRFSVRKPRSTYSPANRQRLRSLVRRGKVAKDVLPSVRAALKEDRFVVPADILRALRANAKAWKNFRGFSPAYIRIRVGFIEGARRRPEEFAKRLRHFLRMTEQNRMFGFGGIEKHY
jgi:uncharacterized protein YdeI (YjbR/CyaY-like superfamily)